jgi:dTDP-4-amino-4,6-dideoxygalactose transaminase
MKQPKTDAIPLVRPMIGRREMAAVAAVLRSGQIAQGAEVEAFEAEFAEMCGTREAVAVNSGTAALFVALAAHGIGPGDEVIVPPFSFVATASCVLMTGAHPVFVDVREDDFNIDPELIEQHITPHTRAIIPVHLYGQPADMTLISEIAERHGLAIIEDACQAHAAEWRGKRAGSFGTGTFSFYPTKNMTTGEGGMITTNDPAVAEQSRLLRSHGAPVTYHHVQLGYNCRMTEIAAAMGRVQLHRLPAFTRKRRANARYYDKHLRGVVTPRQTAGALHVHHQYTIRVPQGRDELKASLTARGVGSAIYYPKAIHDQPMYRDLGYEDSCPVAERLCSEVLSLPIWPGLTSSQRQRVVEAVLEWAAVTA